MKNDKVLIVTHCSYPYGSPMSLRIRAFANLFKKIGYSVIVLCSSISNELNNNNSAVYENEKIYSLNNIKGSNKTEYKKYLDKIILQENPDIIFSNCINSRYSIIKKIASKHEKPIIINSVEWYNPSTFKFGRFSYSYISFIFCWKFLYTKADGCVAISRVLEDHYKKYISNVIRIPTIVDSKNVNHRIDIINDSNRIKLLFAGSLARTKDSIKEFIFALDKLPMKKRNKICFEICGITTNELVSHIGKEMYEKYKNQIEICGKVPQSSIAQKYFNSDYGIFVRPNQRSSHAGFSTKLGEGMIIGTPFIINDTGDISLYIKNGYNGFIIKKDNESISKLYDIILGMSQEERKKLRINARKTAEEYFYYEKYIDEFREFLKKVRRNYDNKRI